MGAFINMNSFDDKFKESQDTSEKFDEFIKNLDISIAELEKSGAFFLTLGYSNFFRGADLDVLEILERNFTGDSPAEVTLIGQQFVLMGYVILYIVALKRYDEKQLRLTQGNENINLAPYKILTEAYLASACANYLRYLAFSQILKDSFEN